MSAAIGHSAREAGDFEALARDRADVRSLERADLADIVRIDRRIMERDRSACIGRVADEALLESAIRVLFAAHRDGSVTGLIMASVDFGDFGRTGPAPGLRQAARLRPRRRPSRAFAAVVFR